MIGEVDSEVVHENEGQNDGPVSDRIVALEELDKRIDKSIAQTSGPVGTGNRFRSEQACDSHQHHDACHKQVDSGETRQVYVLGRQPGLEDGQREQEGQAAGEAH